MLESVVLGEAESIKIAGLVPILTTVKAEHEEFKAHAGKFGFKGFKSQAEAAEPKAKAPRRKR